MGRLLLAVVTLLLAASRSAEARVLADESDSDPPSLVSINSDTLKRPKKMRVVVTGTPRASIEGGVGFVCFSGKSFGKEGDSSRHYEDADGRFELTGKPSLPHARECFVKLSAHYADLSQAGTIRVKVFGVSKRR